MNPPVRGHILVVAALAIASAGVLPLRAQGPSQTDLDALMARVVARRDDNWKRLQQYVLDEHEQIDLRATAGTPLWSERREFTWYIRDGFFVRSPVRFNGVAIGDGDRRQYEASFLRRTQRRDQRETERLATEGTAPEPSDLQAMIRQLREPQFVSSAYFLQFQFESGRYAFVGRELVDDREVLRIEYYPARLFSADGNSRIDRRRVQLAGRESDEAYAAEVSRLMNEKSVVTLWVEPTAGQIVKYLFDNTGLEFFPRSWLLRADDLDASMTMGEAFPGVWLPRRIDLQLAVTLAIGRLNARYRLDYFNYRQADVSIVIRGAGGR